MYCFLPYSLIWPAQQIITLNLSIIQQTSKKCENFFFSYNLKITHDTFLHMCQLSFWKNILKYVLLQLWKSYEIRDRINTPKKDVQIFLLCDIFLDFFCFELDALYFLYSKRISTLTRGFREYRNYGQIIKKKIICIQCKFLNIKQDWNNAPLKSYLTFSTNRRKFVLLMTREKRIENNKSSI